MKFSRHLYNAAQKAWCQRYECETTFEPLMCGYEAGEITFVQAAKESIRWFEGWSNDAHLRASDGTIPGDEWVDPDTGESRVTPRPAPHKKPPQLPPPEGA